MVFVSKQRTELVNSATKVRDTVLNVYSSTTVNSQTFKRLNSRASLNVNFSIA